MHENQLVYPSQHQEDYDRQYPLFNFKSMIAADRIFFNSQFHLDALFDALPKFLKAFPDKRNIDLLSGLKEKSQVLSLGIDPPMPDIQTRNDIPVILWNHRWEHDKHPDLFFKSLITCSELGLKFRLIVCGEHFDQTPDIFKRAKDILAQHIIHWGFAETREVYQTLLAQSDLLPVTSHQEYFGLSVMEAAAYGVDLLLPNRLVYPELYKGSAAQFYDSDRAFEQLLQASIQSPRFSKIDVSQYYWKEVVKDYEQAFRALIKS
jgi:glycosyltransferase involved in cell wall biosynthesis